MCNVHAKQEDNGSGEVVARFVYGPLEKFFAWAFIGGIILLLSTAVTTAVLVFKYDSLQTSADKRDAAITRQTELLNTATNVMTQLTTKMENWEVWRASIDVTKRYNTEDAAKDREADASARRELQKSIAALQQQVFQLSRDLATHRESPHHTATNTALQALEKRLDLLEHTLKGKDTS